MPATTPSKSPVWHNPKALLRRITSKRTKRRSEFDSSSQPAHCSFSAGPSAALDFSTPDAGGSQDVNPFRTSPRKFQSRAKRFKAAAKSPRKGRVSKPIRGADDDAAITCPTDCPLLFKAVEPSLRRSISHFSIAPSCSQQTPAPPTDFSSLLGPACSSSTDSGYDTDNTNSNRVTTASASKRQKSATQLPISLALATRLRIFSSNPFPWSTLSAEANVLIKVTATVLTSLTTINGDCSDYDCSNEAVQDKLNSSLYYWAYPSIPGIPNFPRFTPSGRSGIRLRNQISVPHSLADAIRKSLKDKWQDCFLALCKSLKNESDCPMFYVCAPDVTAVFLAPRCNQTHDCMTAIIAPTSNTLRDALKADDIEYFTPLKRGRHSSSSLSRNLSNSSSSHDPNLSTDSLSGIPPLRHESHSMIEPLPSIRRQASLANFGNVTSSILSDSDNDDNDDGKEDDSDAGDHDTSTELEWLKEVGFSPRVRGNLKKSVVNRAGFADNRVQSTILIIDTTPNSSNNVKKLVSFIVNDSTHFWTNIGPQSSYPPTLLSPTPFVDASLQKLKLSTGRTQKDDKSSVYYTDISGPILPSTSFNICQVLDASLGHPSRETANPAQHNPSSGHFFVQWQGTEHYQDLNGGLGVCSQKGTSKSKSGASTIGSLDISSTIDIDNPSSATSVSEKVAADNVNGFAKWLQEGPIPGRMAMDGERVSSGSNISLPGIQTSNTLSYDSVVVKSCVRRDGIYEWA